MVDEPTNDSANTENNAAQPAEQPQTNAPAAEKPAVDPAPEAPAEETAAPQELKSYKVDLYQSYWARSLTESFHVEAASQEEANQKAEEILATKDLPKDGKTTDWDFVLTPLGQ